ncbi:MAG: hypothetical protein AAFW81_12390 [Pseudomonadota bacterium]
MIALLRKIADASLIKVNLYPLHVDAYRQGISVNNARGIIVKTLCKLKAAGLLVAFVGACAANGSTSGNDPASEQASSDAVPGYVRTGAYEDCIDVDKIVAVSALSDFQFLVRGEDVAFLSELDDRCDGASDGASRIEIARSQSSLCEGDAVTIVERLSGDELRTCSLGAFEVLLNTEIGPQLDIRD